MTSYRIHFWEDGAKYTTVITSSNVDDLRQMLKQQYDRFTMEEV